MFLKKLMAMVLTASCLCITLSVPTFAETTDSIVDVAIMPRYQIAVNPTSDLSISGQSAYCYSKVRGKGLSNITVTQTLEKYSGWFAIWNNVDGASWTKTVTGTSIDAENTISGLTSGTYRLKSVFTLNKEGEATETITVYSAEKVVD